LPSGGKIKCTDFPPEVVVIADKSKNLLHCNLTFGNWVLDSDIDKLDWVWKIINKTPGSMGSSARDVATKGLKMVSAPSQDNMRNKLISYVRVCLFDCLMV